MEQKTIGVSIFFSGNTESIFNSGVQQNALYVAELLLNCGYNVKLIYNHTEHDIDLKSIQYDPRFVFITENEMISYQFDLILIVGYDFLTSEMIRHLKANQTKLVFYKCGNDYFSDCETFCYNVDRNISHRQNCFDEIWSVPQNYELNYFYWKTIYRCPIIQAPFVWSQKLVDKEEWLYEPSGNTEKRVAIFEPNISLIKCAIPPLMICENAYRQNKNISKIFVTNITDVKKEKNLNNSALDSFVKLTELHIDNKIFIEDRYRTVPMMKFSADIAVSHTFCNPLNYLYFDLAWMGYPIVHNAYMCKDVGYFYRDNDYEQAGCVLSKTILTHDLDYKDYLYRNRLNIDKYLPTNIKLQYKYKKLMENILKNYIF